MNEKAKNYPENKLYRLYLAGFLLILALPLLNLPPWFSPPDWGKTVVFRIALSLLLFFFLWQLLSQEIYHHFLTAVRKRLWGKNKLFSITLWLFLCLFLLFSLSTIFSSDIRFSLWGSPYRSGGFVNTICYFLFTGLLFLIIKKNDWQKIIFFVISVGILVSFIALIQKFNLFGNKFFVHFEDRPASTIGGSIFLAIYLLELSFLSLGSAIKEKWLLKKVFFLLSLALFIFVIFHTETRAAYVGLAIGFSYFLAFYPKRSKWLKISFLGLLILGTSSFLFLKTNPEILLLKKSGSGQRIVERILSIPSGLTDSSRISAWQVSLKAIIARPIFGYGQENFGVGFDRYYDPSLPKIQIDPEMHSSWWDRAHSFIFEIATTNGVPALFVYLVFFGLLFWQLEKLKQKENQDKIIIHSLQASFLAYFTALFFGFDTLSSYLILFLLIAYSLHLIAENNADINAGQAPNLASNQRIDQRKFSDKSLAAKFFSAVTKQRKLILISLFFLLMWFIWQFNIKPFGINSEINIAKYLVENGECESGLLRMEKTLKQKSILDAYFRLKYATLLQQCAAKTPEKELLFAQKGYSLLRESTKSWPTFTRNWLLLGEFTNFLIEKEKDPQKKKALIEEANAALAQAEKLSPNRQEVFLGWTKAALVSKEYQSAEEKAQKCINLNPELAECYWLMALAKISANKPEAETQTYIEIAKKYYDINSFTSINQLATAYSASKNLPKLAEQFEKLIAIKPNNPDYYAQLAFIYKDLGQFNKARTAALKVIELVPTPEVKAQVEEFLTSLPVAE